MRANFVRAARAALVAFFVLTAMLWPLTYHRWDVSLPFVDRHDAGFDIHSRRGRYELIVGDSDLLDVTYVPKWFALLVTTISWVAVGFIPRRSKNPVNNLCRGCGYDLRASPDRCPECGTPVAR